MSLGLGLGCGPDTEDLDVWTGVNVTYYSSQELQACGGTHEYVDGFASFVASQLGVPVPSGLSYMWLSADEFDATRCDDLSGCFYRGYAVSLEPALLHEVVHGVGEDFGRWPFFSEGIATAYDPFNGLDVGLRYVVSPEGVPTLPDPRPMMLANKASDVPYPVAGGFVIFLVARHGTDKLTRLMQSLPKPCTSKKLDETFFDVYRVQLDDEAMLFMNQAPCDTAIFDVPVYDCTMPTIEGIETPGGVAFNLSRSMDCSSESVAGGVRGANAWPSISSASLQIPTPGLYQMDVQSDSDVFVQMGPCFGCPWRNGDTILEGGGNVNVQLDAGLHFVRIRALSNESPVVEFQLAPL